MIEGNTWHHITPPVITVVLLYCVNHFFSPHFCIICHFSMLTHICPEEGGSMLSCITDTHLPDHTVMSCHVMFQTTTISNSVVTIHVPSTEFKYNWQCKNLLISVQPFKTGHYHFLPMLHSSFQHTSLPAHMTPKVETMLLNNTMTVLHSTHTLFITMTTCLNAGSSSNTVVWL